MYAKVPVHMVGIPQKTSDLRLSKNIWKTYNLAQQVLSNIDSL